MLIADEGTRPDGVWFFSDKQYTGSLAIKLYNSPISQDTHKENETSSDIRCCFLKKEEGKGRREGVQHICVELNGMPEWEN